MWARRAGSLGFQDASEPRTVLSGRTADFCIATRAQGRKTLTRRTERGSVYVARQ